ncbi:hypothetical protein JCM17960_31100 [Magnetospira thiophila]
MIGSLKSRRPRWRGVLLALGLAVAVLGAGTGRAATLKGPVYNEETKSYFALMEAENDQKFWDTLDIEAAGQTYKEVNGRLAIIPSRSVHDFLVQEFGLRHPTWIGLRYWCQFKSLQWVDGSKVETTDFQIWQAPWYRDREAKCDDNPRSKRMFMPVYYEPRNYREKGSFLIGSKTDDVHWRATGHETQFRHYLIEYPTGAP